MKRLSTIFALTLLLIAFSALYAFAQITPSDDSYTLTSTPTVNFGAKTTLEVESSGATTFLRFDLSGICLLYTSSCLLRPSHVDHSILSSAQLVIVHIADSSRCSLLSFTVHASVSVCGWGDFV